MPGYGQFCPIAKAMEILDERWTLLVVRELLAGSTRFNELRRGNPKMSPALLSKRLRSLERAGLLRRETAEGRTGYRLTPAGEELSVVVGAIGTWAQRWIGDLGEQDYDPHLLMWDMRRTVPVEAWPPRRSVVAFEFSDVHGRAARWWLVVTAGEADVCDYDPGFEVTARISASLRTVVRIWRGDLAWGDALESGAVIVYAPRHVRRALPNWIGQARLAAVERPA